MHNEQSNTTSTTIQRKINKTRYSYPRYIFKRILQHCLLDAQCTVHTHKSQFPILDLDGIFRALIWFGASGSLSAYMQSASIPLLVNLSKLDSVFIYNVFFQNYYHVTIHNLIF